MTLKIIMFQIYFCLLGLILRKYFYNEILFNINYTLIEIFDIIIWNPLEEEFIFRCIMILIMCRRIPDVLWYFLHVSNHLLNPLISNYLILFTYPY